MNLKPLHNKVVIKSIPSETTSPTGIILNSADEPDRAQVLAIGPDVHEVEIGDIVLLDWNKVVKSDDYFVIKVDDIVFIYGE